MEILENKNNMTILKKEGFIYLISYKTPIAKVSNTIETDPEKTNNYGIYFTNAWNYSRTTLKQLYNFIELYTTQRDNTGNTISYMLGKEKNKKEYIKKLINNNTIKIINKEDL